MPYHHHHGIYYLTTQVVLLLFVMATTTTAFMTSPPTTRIARQQSLTLQQEASWRKIRTGFPRTSLSSSLGAAADGDTDDKNDSEPSNDNGEKRNLLGRFKGNKNEEDDGLSFREKLAKGGLSLAMTYGSVSNFNYSISLSIAWYLFSKRTALSPLNKGQWAPFLAVYAGFYVFGNIIRPLRFTAAVALAPYFDRLIQWIQKRTKLSRGKAVGLAILFVNVLGTFALMFTGVAIASIASGVPAIPLQR